MISPRTVCFVYFALLFGLPHAEDTSSTEVTTVTNVDNATNDDNELTNQTTMNDSNDIASASHHTPGNEKQKSTSATAKQPVCTPTSPENNPSQKQCIFSLPTGDPLILTVVALTVGCLALLLISLICFCQVCHLRGIISSLQPRHENIDLRSMREKSECMNEGQADGQPTEACVMLSEVTTGQDESGEHEENKPGEMKDTEEPSAEPPVTETNGDVTQKNSQAPDTNAAESSDTGV